MVLDACVLFLSAACDPPDTLHSLTKPLACRGALFLWIGVFLVAAIGYGTTEDAKFLGETGGDKRMY